MKPRNNILMAIIVACTVILVASVGPGCATAAGGSKGGVATIAGGLRRVVTVPLKALSGKSGAAAPSSQAGGASVPDIATLQQSGNPSAPSTQNYDFAQSEEVVYSQNTVIVTETKEVDGSSTVVTQHIPAGSKKRMITNQKVGQVIGAAQADTSAGITAKLNSFKMIQWVGAIVFLIGCVGFAHPAVRLLIGGKDTAVVAALAGLVMIFGPVLFVTYEKYFFMSLVAVAGYWVFSRLKYKEGLLDAKVKADTNST